MSKVVNLKRHRKRLIREDKNVKAEENRRRFGRTRAEREKQEVEDVRAQSRLDGHKRES